MSYTPPDGVTIVIAFAPTPIYNPPDGNSVIVDLESDGSGAPAGFSNKQSSFMLLAPG